MKVGRRAFTMLEMLVVLAVIGALLALIFPAVQMAREAARRQQCAKNLEQIGIALQSFHATKGHFPPASSVSDPWMGYSGFALLLSYVGELPDLKDPFEGNRIGEDMARVRYHPFQTYRCPSDPGYPFERRGNTNYRFSHGPAPFHSDDARMNGWRALGAFRYGYYFSASDFLDGLSQTVGLSEKLLGDANPNRFDPRRDFWCLNAYPDFTATQMADRCNNRDAAAPHSSIAGERWVELGYQHVLFNHVVTPNSAVPDCEAVEFGPRGSCNGIQGGSFAARSNHSGGVNCLMMDGAVHFIDDSIDRYVWWAYGTRAGGEDSQR